MLEIGITPEFIAALYEAALDPSGLTSLAKLIRQTLGVANVGLWITDDGGVTDLTLSSDTSLSHQPAYDFGQKLSVMPHGNYGNFDVALTGVAPNSDGDRQRAHFYNDFARRHGFTNPLGASMNLGGTKSATIALDQNGDGPSTADPRPVALDVVLPHLEYALQLRARFYPELKPVPSYGLDRLSFGALICDAKAVVVYANPAAIEVARLATSILIRAKDKTVGAVAAHDSQRLGVLIQDAATRGVTGSLLVSDRDGTPALIALVAPLAQIGANNPGPVHAMIAIRPMSATTAFDAARLTQLFRLSPAQAYLAIALYEGRSFDEIAFARNVKISTLRTHFAEVLNRTGATGLRD